MKKYTIDVGDVQSLVLSGHGKLADATYLLLSLGEVASARRWLAALPVSRGADPDDVEAVHVAFTWSGLGAAGLHEDALDEFPSEFCEGMDGNEHRSRVLGDVGENAPANWQWGNAAADQARGRPLHAVLMLYAKDAAGLEALLARERARLDASDIVAWHQLDSRMLYDADKRTREHFGFVDGLMNPVVLHDGDHENAPPLLRKSRAEDVLLPGEFLLGYSNEFFVTPESPTLSGALDPEERLRVKDGFKSRRDVGRSGTYLVFRQLEQDVHAFWEYVGGQAQSEQERILLAAKMVGRWPSGAPLIENAALRDFGFEQEDPDGLHCPFGSHIRRANPRDSLRENEADAIKLAKHHRLLRRGRPYGPPVDPSMLPERILAAPRDGERRGLHFICLSANLARQFEFVQHSWLNNPDFDGVWNEVDPIAGVGPRATRNFTVQEAPLRRRHRELPSFVRLRGGAYFFLPGMRLLKYLAG